MFHIYILEKSIWSLVIWWKITLTVVVYSVSPALCDPVNCNTPCFPVLHYLPEFAQARVHWVGDAIQPSHSLLTPFPPAFNLSQHQCLSHGCYMGIRRSLQTIIFHVYLLWGFFLLPWHIHLHLIHILFPVFVLQALSGAVNILGPLLAPWGSRQYLQLSFSVRCDSGSWTASSWPGSSLPVAPNLPSLCKQHCDLEVK